MECLVREMKMFYEEVGAGKPILILHGLSVDHQSMANDMEPIFTRRNGWRRIYPDLPGMGRSQAADRMTHQDQVLDQVIAFIDTVIPGERFVVAGASYGGYFARGLVYHRGSQIDGLCLYVPLIDPDVAKLNLPQHQVIHEDPAFLAQLTPDEQDMRGFVLAQSMDLLMEFRQLIAPALEMADHAFMQRLEQQLAYSYDVDALPTPFPAPTLLLTGRQDNWVGYQEAYQLLDHYPRASFAVLDRAGHSLASEQRVLFRAFVHEWLNRVEEYTYQESNVPQYHSNMK